MSTVISYVTVGQHHLHLLRLAVAIWLLFGNAAAEKYTQRWQTP